MNKKIKKVSKIGGQAVLEGVMMRGEHAIATAVRDEYGNIVVESERITPAKEKFKILGLPIIRGVVAFLDSLIKGTSILLKSAEVYGGDMGEPSKFEKWLADKTKIKVLDIAIAIGVILGLGLSIGLFFFLPNLITTGILELFPSGVSDIIKNIIEGVIRIIIFVGYVMLVTMLDDIKRTFMYHGAEHKVISCYEHDLPMTVENARTMSTRHDRCGTTFLFIVMIISIVIFSFFKWGDSMLLRLVTRLALLPLVAGVSYEILKLLARSDNFIARAFKYPGLLLQKLTTKEPTDDMLEVSLMAFNTVMAMDSDSSIPEQKFKLKKDYKTARKEIEKIIETVTSEKAEVDWIFVHVTGKKRSELVLLRTIEEEQYLNAKKIAEERKTGRPLQYILGSTDFYGLEILLDESVLIPRPETEILVEKALPYCTDKTVLDLCTGSGAIALAIKSKSNATVYGSDISEKAVEKARENAKHNNLQVEFIVSDLFDALIGKKYDIITANPPYITTADIDTLQNEVKSFEPIIALDGGFDGMSIISRIIYLLSNHLNEGGMLFMEVGIDQAENTVRLLIEQDFKAEIIKDLEGVDRIIKAVK